MASSDAFENVEAVDLGDRADAEADGGHSHNGLVRGVAFGFVEDF